MSEQYTCNHLGCNRGPFPTSEIARKHRYRYHSIPVPFIICGRQYVVGNAYGRYACPLPECERLFTKREDTQVHIIVDHNGSEKIKVFDTPELVAVPPQNLLQPCASPQEFSLIENLSPHIPISELPLHEETGRKSPPCGVGATTVSLLPSVDYLESNEALDALGLCMHSRLKVLFCCSCRVALTSGMIAGHTKNHHQSYKVSSVAMQALLEFALNRPSMRIQGR
ncbi:hypothetical protein BD769DRAFT_1684433 [Suillus cothurnatus]|nr:hypothetical protein BD769DRAFT_1684433 [Suillus cothurnatus]